MSVNIVAGNLSDAGLYLFWDVALQGNYVGMSTVDMKSRVQYDHEKAERVVKEMVTTLKATMKDGSPATKKTLELLEQYLLNKIKELSGQDGLTGVANKRNNFSPKRWKEVAKNLTKECLD